MKKIAESKNCLACFLVLLICFSLAEMFDLFAQGVPRINALFPAGGQIGTIVDVAFS